MNRQNGYGFFDILNLASLMVGLQNLSENRSQSEHNDIQRENDRQATYLLAEIARLFAELNRRLSEQDETLEKIKKTLQEMRGENNEQRKAD